MSTKNENTITANEAAEMCGKNGGKLFALRERPYDIHEIIGASDRETARRQRVREIELKEKPERGPFNGAILVLVIVGAFVLLSGAVFFAQQHEFEKALNLGLSGLIQVLVALVLIFGRRARG